MYTQLKAFNTSTVGKLGWCLKYGDDGFGLQALYPTAWDAWMQTDYPHNDRNIPQDVAVPLWFDYWKSGIRYGHVVVSVPGKGFYSSPWKAGQTHAVLGSIAEVERIYGVTFVGWSEDISNVRVAKLGGEGMTEQDAENLAFRIGLLAHGTLEQLDANWQRDNGGRIFRGGYAYAAAMAQQLAEGKVWQDYNNKGVNYDKDVKAAYDKGKAEGNTPDAQVLQPGNYKVE